jgi:hypothetical protein
LKRNQAFLDGFNLPILDFVLLCPSHLLKNGSGKNIANSIYSVTVLCYIVTKGGFYLSNDLISKKDLLELTGISYGQLYRWKRKNLIPEDWFIRKSTFTGQETFFPKVKILERINKIQAMKENLSLDDLANMFSPDSTKSMFTETELIDRNIVSKQVMMFYLDNQEAKSEYSFDEILVMYILENLLGAGTITLDDGKMVTQVFMKHKSISKTVNGELFFLRKFGISTCMLIVTGEDVIFEEGINLVARISLMEQISELKTLLIS